MDKDELRHSYRYDRVLIDAARVITPTLPSIALRVNGAQVEMLRNVVEYLNRRDSFVSEYHDGYYDSPDDTDWEKIRERIADLEHKLMGDINTLFGVKERWSENLGETKTGDGTYSALTTVVPAGYIYVLQLASVANFTTAPGISYILVADGVTSFYAKGAPSLTVYQPLWHSDELVLGPGDWIQLVLGGCINGDDIRAGVWGYKMKV